MTILHATNALLDHFTSKDTFDEDDFDSIKLAYEGTGDNAHFGILFAALEQLVEDGVIVEIDEMEWMLREPLNMRGQDIHISSTTASAVAMVINAWLHAQGATGARANAMNLSEVDIVMLYNILGDILEMETKKGGKDADEENEDGEDFDPGQFGGPNDGAN